jgi:general stress protein YciG
LHFQIFRIQEKLNSSNGGKMPGNQQRDQQGRSQGTSNRGFASMDPEQQREIASKGGRAAHEQGTAHEFTPEEAREAGSKGGRAVSQDREHMSQIGQKGGEARGGSNRSRNRNTSKQDNEESEDSER